MSREQDLVGVVKKQLLNRLQRLAVEEQGSQHAQRGLIGSAQPTRWRTDLLEHGDRTQNALVLDALSIPAFKCMTCFQVHEPGRAISP